MAQSWYSDEVLEWLDKSIFKDLIASEYLVIYAGSKFAKRVPKSGFWLQHPKASHYHKIEFNPSKPPGGKGVVWNTWSGFGIEAKVGSSWDLLKNGTVRGKL